MCPDAMVLTRASEVSVLGIDNRVQTTTNYVVLQVLLPGHDKSNDLVTLAEVRREFHIVTNLRCKMIIGEDIIEPEGFVIDSRGWKAPMALNIMNTLDHGICQKPRSNVIIKGVAAATPSKNVFFFVLSQSYYVDPASSRRPQGAQNLCDFFFTVFGRASVI
jgi:hypothetical protein